MARATKTTTTTKPAVRGRKSGRPASVAAKAPAKVTKPAAAPKRATIVAPVSTGRKPSHRTAAVVPAKAPTKVTNAAAAPKPAPVATAPAVKLSKDELRVQVEKLERANATLRAKNREANSTAKTANVRIAELEKIVAGLEKKAAQATPAKVEKAAAKLTRVKRQSGKVSSGAAMPPDMAVQEPAPHEAEAALEHREEQLGHD
jgi:hypothetical protein